MLQDNLLLLKIIYLQIQKTNDAKHKIEATKTYLISEISRNFYILESKPYFPSVLLSNINAQQVKEISKCIIKILHLNQDTTFLTHEAVNTNGPILTGILIELLKQLLKLLERSSNYPLLSKIITKSNFDLTEFFKQIENIEDYFKDVSNHLELDDDNLNIATFSVEIIKQLQVYNLDEKYQLTTVFVLLALKKACDSKKLKKKIDSLLLMIFEMSPKHPDLFKILPIKFIFSFDDNTMLDLLTLKIRTNNRLAIIKCILELAVKKVKTDDKVVKKIVKILLSNQRNMEGTTIDYFSNSIFQITCLILPLIAKEKRAITTSAYRSILAELQEELHKALLKSFQCINFSKENSLLTPEVGNTDDSTISDSSMATLNAMEAYSLTLSKYCETTNVEEIKNLDCLWSGLEYFVNNSVSIKIVYIYFECGIIRVYIEY